MIQKSKENLAKWIESLATKVSQDPSRDVFEVDGQVYFSDLGNEYGPELRTLSAAVLEAGGWGRKLSVDYVEERILEILLELINTPMGEGALTQLERLSESLDSYEERRTVYLTLSGVEMTDLEELRLGEVVLKKMTEDQKVEIVGALVAEDDKERFLDRVRTGPFAVIAVSAEPIRAWAVAVERTRDVLDLLRYSVPFFSGENLDPEINLLGLNTSPPPLVAVHAGKTEDLFDSLGDVPTSLRLAKESIRTLEAAGVFEAAKLAGKEGKTELEERVLRGIRWVSDSQGQREPDNKILSLIIALECLLPSSRFGGSGTWTAEGAALLLGADFGARKAIRNRVRGLYKKRNNVVHGGGGERITAADVVWLRNTVHDIIRTIVKRRSELESPEGKFTIATWLEDLKLADGTA